MSRPLESVPSDNTTLREVLDAYGADGHDGVFELVGDDGDVRCGRCQQTAIADHVPILSVRRLEGASDPADMLAVCAVTCPNCDGRGTLVVGFGPSATMADSAFLTRAPDARGAGSSLPNSPAAEVSADRTA